MAQVTLKGKPVKLAGTPPEVSTRAPDFLLTDKDLRERSLQEFHGKKKILASVPSLDTPTCSTMTKHLNDFAKQNPEIQVIIVSADLPFAQKRFCDTENVHNLLILSMIRDKKFGQSYGLLIQDGPLAGLLTRSIFALDENDQVLYLDLVSEITTEPEYQKAFEKLQ